MRKFYAFAVSGQEKNALATPCSSPDGTRLQNSFTMARICPRRLPVLHFLMAQVVHDFT